MANKKTSKVKVTKATTSKKAASTKTKAAKKAAKPYKKEFDAIVKANKQIGHITYDELQKKIQEP